MKLMVENEKLIMCPETSDENDVLDKFFNNAEKKTSCQTFVVSRTPKQLGGSMIEEKVRMYRGPKNEKFGDKNSLVLVFPHMASKERDPDWLE